MSMQSACMMVAVSVLDVGKGTPLIRDRWMVIDRDMARVKPELISVVAIPGLSGYSNTLEPARVGQSNPERQAY